MLTIDWNKLHTYSGDNKKSFEELCYQIVSEEYKDIIENGATLTSIDDSGGGDGVEFYLTLDNGEVFGWQAKFFGRLSEGGRKEQIKKSLQTSYKKHPELKKWFLCSKCNFTPEEKTWFDNKLSTSTKNGERVLLEENNVELIHWGESEFLKYLKDYSAIHKFFFSKKLLTQEWFEERYRTDIQKSQIKAKYESKIHIPTNIDDAINKVLGGNRLVEILANAIEKQQVEMYAKDYEDAFLKLFSEEVINEYKSIQIKIREFLKDKDKIIDQSIQQLQKIQKAISNKNEKELKNKVEVFEKYIDSLRNFQQEYNTLTESDFCNPIQYFRDEHIDLPIPEDKLEKSRLIKFKNFIKKIFLKKEIQTYKPSVPSKGADEIRVENIKRQKARDILFTPLYALEEYAITSLEGCLKVFELIDQNELHITGEAGMGKTHISFNIYEDQITKQNNPAIFIFAKDICTDLSLENQLKDNLNIPIDWAFDDFLGALELTARVNKTKVPIIIDGLNESDYWNSIWKNGLEKLIIKIKTYYPHIVLITTYRTSYEDQLFPYNYFKYEDRWKLKRNVRGFYNLRRDAIKTYFDFYKIKLDNHSNAIRYFEHPLHLKLFCETKNPNRESKVKVSFQNEDLFEVFDEYIKNSNKNITNSLLDLDSKYDADFTEKKLLQLSKYIWENNSRGIPRSEELLTNKELGIFEGENLLLFRDWNRQSNIEEIQFTYDLLGGYFISKYLTETYDKSYPILKIKTDNFLTNFIKIGLEFIIPESGTKYLGRTFSKLNNIFWKKSSLLRFAKSREFRKKLLNSKTEHPLFEDTLRTICILLIKKSEIFLFDVLKNDRARKYSTESLFEINAKYIYKNKELIKSFLKAEFFFRNKKTYLLGLAENVELDNEHPLNFNFWSDNLCELSMPERDLSWSEYIRKNHSGYGNSYFLKFVNHFEEVCKEERKLSSRVHFAAKKTMWILTTNIRSLRDEATRALYYYSRKYPKDFLDLLVYSLNINDPYVLERMLSVSYGLAMAKQNDFNDDSHQKEWLTEYGRILFDSLFSNNAKHTTSHILARDYAKRTIDITLLHNPNLLNGDEKNLIQYPLKKYPHLNWGKSKDRNKGEYRDGNAPIHMDFENYTIGRLIKDRRNYDSEHKEYKQVLSQIYWRIYNLGHSLEKFGEIDKQISRSNWRHYSREHIGKIDRYGKKYSWIAFYEMAGYRSDLGLLKDWNNEDNFRISDVDIDPSFPNKIRQYDLISCMRNSNFLGDMKIFPDKWYNSNSDLDISEYILSTNDLGINARGDWILLKGFISQRNIETTRDIHIAINTVTLNDDDFCTVIEPLNNFDDYTFEYIRDFDGSYLFQGEIPWCDLMPNNDSYPFRLNYNYHNVTKTKKELIVFNDDKEITQTKLKQLIKKEIERLDKSSNKYKLYFSCLYSKYYDFEDIQRIAKDLGFSVKYIDKPYVKKVNDYLDLNIQPTIFRCSFDSYINNGETIVPSKEVCEHLNLYLKPQSSDLYNKKGGLISTSFKFGEEFGNTSVFTYIKRDYLNKYLKDKNKKMMWVQWAEKRYFPNGVKNIHQNGDKGTSQYRTYYKIIL